MYIRRRGIRKESNIYDAEVENKERNGAGDGGLGDREDIMSKAMGKVFSEFRKKVEKLVLFR